MFRSGRVFAAMLSISIWPAFPQDERLPTRALVTQFCETQDITEKEKLLYRITQEDSQAGQHLLQLAKTTTDNDTRWLAIRGLGTLKFNEAAPFLIDSLQSPEHYARANAARALGELRYSAAKSALIHLLETEQEGGVIEQTSLALRMIKAHDAVPVLKTKMSHNSIQTRCWILDAIAELGNTNDLPFIAKYLYDSDANAVGVPLCAARGIATLTKEDFGLPNGSGIFDPVMPVLKARNWWEEASKQHQH